MVAQYMTTRPVFGVITEVKGKLKKRGNHRRSFGARFSHYISRKEYRIIGGVGGRGGDKYGLGVEDIRKSYQSYGWY